MEFKPFSEREPVRLVSVNTTKVQSSLALSLQSWTASEPSQAVSLVWLFIVCMTSAADAQSVQDA